MINLIVSYSKNLKLLFNNQTSVLERVESGDLSGKVAVATSDEFGVIANHTNHMIDGLRHRFELMSSLRLAEEVQQNLLPSKSPYLKGFDIWGSSLYCEQTGGDYYDYFLLPDGKLGVAVADVCGHGVGAAMLMISVRAYLVSAIKNYEDPARLLESVNESLSKDCAVTGNFTSMFFLEIDPDRKKLKWVRAGHEPAICYSSSTGNFSHLGGPGVVLGVDESCRYANQTMESLSKGDLLLIGTDGIKEATNMHEEQFGEQLLREILQNNAHESTRKIGEEIFLAVHRYRDGLPQEDDISFVVMKVRG